MNFTDRIAQYIKENNRDLKHLTIVLPSMRAKKYIARSLYREFGKPILAPKMVTIDRWVKELSTRSVIDKTRALVKLFEIQLKNAKTEEDKSFDEFINWGAILLSDFDEIDRYLLDSKQVFKNLAEIKEIENWSFGQQELTESQKRFMEFWDRLPGYYEALNKELESDKTCYFGSAYKEVQNNLDLVFKEDPNAHFLFAGFNALSAAEISLMRQLTKMGRADVLVNADEFYLNKDHEAGRFILQLHEQLQLPTKNFVEQDLGSKTCNIEIVECAQTTGQVKVASTHLQQLSKEEIDETLILLADESLIVPLLKNLPKNIGNANITLGLPLRTTALKTWMELYFNIQENKTRFKSDALYHVDLIRLLNHPFIVAISDKEETIQIQELERNILQRNRIFIKREDLPLSEKLKNVILTFSNNCTNQWPTLVKEVRGLNKHIYENLTDDFTLEKAIIQAFDGALIDFQTIVEEGLPEMSLKSFRSLMMQHWNTKSVAYLGNPIKGLQIMGLLETRLLDFKRIICLGLNEGTMPPTNPIQTMIPMDLRRFLGLPTPRQKQGLFAHHFYRLLHKCEEMVITYTSASESIGSNEQSRYIMQLELELAKANKNINIERKFYTIPLTEDVNTTKEIYKTQDILNRLDEMFAKSASASTLKNYYTCPLDFYYKHVLEFGEQNTVEESIENSTFGTFIHNTLEHLFEPFARRGEDGELKAKQPTNITSRDIDNMLGQYERLLGAEFLKHFDGNKEAFQTGKNLLSYEMANKLTNNFLKEQKKALEQENNRFIESVEELLEDTIELTIHGEVKKIHLKGFVDRIDSKDDKIRIIDYKTGKIKDDDVSISALKEGDSLASKIMGKKYAFQLLLYSFLYHRKYDVLPDEVGIYSLVNVKDGLFSLECKGSSVEEWVERFPELLTEILEEIYDPEIPFTHEAGYYSYCKYCD